MLVLGRRRGESLQLYDSHNQLVADIIIEDIRGVSVRIGVDAPRDKITVLRKEIAHEYISSAGQKTDAVS